MAYSSNFTIVGGLSPEILTQLVATRSSYIATGPPADCAARERPPLQRDSPSAVRARIARSSTTGVEGSNADNPDEGCRSFPYLRLGPTSGDSYDARLHSRVEFESTMGSHSSVLELAAILLISGERQMSTKTRSKPSRRRSRRRAASTRTSGADEGGARKNPIQLCAYPRGFHTVPSIIRLLVSHRSRITQRNAKSLNTGQSSLSFVSA
jgi:hypothetical protein